MFSLRKVMTQKEAECFRAVRKWQRAYLRQRLGQAIFPRPPFINLFRKTHMLGKFLMIILMIVLLPVLIVIWIVRALISLLIFPFMVISTYIRPYALRAPGERNIRGVHYQFARHINLTPELYIKCVDDWVSVLYGPEKLPEYSLATYLDASYALQKRIVHEDDAALNSLLKTQISNAREDLSRDLGNY